MMFIDFFLKIVLFLSQDLFKVAFSGFPWSKRYSLLFYSTHLFIVLAMAGQYTVVWLGRPLRDSSVRRFFDHSIVFRIESKDKKKFRTMAALSVFGECAKIFPTYEDSKGSNICVFSLCTK
jgi:hypothetical protein